MNLARRPPLGLKPAKAKPNPAYLAAVHDLPCIICWSFGETQCTPTQAHHVFCGRFSQAKTPDEMAIPLCESHHQGSEGYPRIAIHRNKSAWVKAYGPDTDYVAVTQDALAHLLVLK